MTNKIGDEENCTKIDKYITNAQVQRSRMTNKSIQVWRKSKTNAQKKFQCIDKS